RCESALPGQARRLVKLGLLLAPDAKPFGKQAVEMVDAAFAADTVTTSVERPTLKPALDLLPDFSVFLLYSIGHCNALGHELVGIFALTRREVEIKNHAAAIGAERQHQIGVHDPFVDVHHEVGKDPGVIGAGAGAHLAGGAARRVAWAQRAGLQTGMG